MRLPTILLGAAAALAVAIPAASFIYSSAEVVDASLHPEYRYQLTLEIDGQYYIADHNLTRTDCMKLVHKAAEWTDGHDRYSCDREPLQVRK